MTNGHDIPLWLALEARGGKDTPWISQAGLLVLAGHSLALAGI